MTACPIARCRQRFFARMEVEPNAAFDALQDDMIRHVCTPCCAIIGRLIDRPPDRRTRVAARDDDHRSGQNLLRMGDQSRSALGDDQRRAHTGGPVRCSTTRPGDLSRPSEQMIVNRAASLSAVTIALAIGGCAVGPDFHRPAAPTDSGYTPEPLATQTASANTRSGEAQHFDTRARHSRRLVDFVSLAATQQPDRAVAARQPRSRRRAGRAAPGAGECAAQGRARYSQPSAPEHPG